MERRNFLKSLGAGGALAGASVPAMAAGVAAEPMATDAPGGESVLLVRQEGLDGAALLAADIALALAAAGVTALRQISVGAGELGSVAGVGKVLAEAGEAKIVGVMDDASALVFQQIAQARGASYLIETQHRVAADGVRHHFTHVALSGAIAWSEPVRASGAQLARLYADVLAGRMPAAIRGQAVAAAGADASTFVSFVLRA